MIRALLILLVTATVAAAQPGAKKPEVSSSAAFKPAELPKLAVIVTSSKLGAQNTTDPQRLVEDAFLECLLAKGYTLAARSDVDSVLREKKFQESGLTEAGAASVGKVLNVPAVLLVRVTELSTNVQNQTSQVKLGARLVSVESGDILWTGNHSDGGPSGRSGAGAVLVRTATALAEEFPDKPRAAGADPRPIDPKAVPKLAVLTVGGAERRVGFGPGSGPRRDTPQSDRDRRVEDVFVQVLLKKGYRLVSRTDLEALVKEQAFQKSGLTEDNAVAAGKLLKVPAVLLVGVTESASEAVGGGRGAKPGVLGRAAVGARLLDVASGEVRWAHAMYDSQVVANKEDAADILDAVAKHVAQFLPPEPDTARGLLEQAVLLEQMRQFTAAKRARDAATAMAARERDPDKPKGSPEQLPREEQDATEQLKRATKLLADDDVYKNDNAVEARKVLEEIVKKWPGTKAAAEAKRQLGPVKSAKERARDEDDAGERLKYARKLLKEGNESEARKRLEKIVKDSPATNAAIEARKELRALKPEK